jgi:hypothetical protein
MIVTGKTEQEHLKNLDNVLSRMQRFGLRANLDKCYFFKENVTYCAISIFAFFLGAHLTDALLSPNFVKIYHNTALDLKMTEFG